MNDVIARVFRLWLTCTFCGAASAGEPVSEVPKAVPRTRPEVKQALEALKDREPRLPLPPLAEEELKAAGGRPPVNNGRMRALYLPERWSTSKSPGRPGGGDPEMTLDYALKTECFWIVSRVNNCFY